VEVWVGADRLAVTTLINIWHIDTVIAHRKSALRTSKVYGNLL